MLVKECPEIAALEEDDAILTSERGGVPSGTTIDGL